MSECGSGHMASEARRRQGISWNWGEPVVSHLTWVKENQAKGLMRYSLMFSKLYTCMSN